MRIAALPFLLALCSSCSCPAAPPGEADAGLPDALEVADAPALDACALPNPGSGPCDPPSVGCPPNDACWEWACDETSRCVALPAGSKDGG